jgi:hypothetical protein
VAALNLIRAVDHVRPEQIETRWRSMRPDFPATIHHRRVVRG